MLCVVRSDTYHEAVDLIDRNPWGQRRSDIHPRRGRRPPVPTRCRCRHDRRQRAHPGARRLPLLRRLEGLAVRRHPHVRPRGHPLLHQGQGHHLRAGPIPPTAPWTSASRGTARGRETTDRGLRRPSSKPDPPAWRVVDLARQAETHGFSYGWTFDSHVLWQEPYVIYSQMLAATNRMVVGPMVTNPGTRNWTVTASLFATPQRHVRQPHRVRHRPGRLGHAGAGHTPTSLATLAESMTVIKAMAEGRRGHLQRHPAAAAVVDGQPARHMDGRLRAAGPQAVRRAGRRLHPPARRPSDNRVDHRRGAPGRRAARARDPDDLYMCVAAPAYVGDDLAHQRDQVRWFGGMVGNHVADLVDRYGDTGAGVPPGPHRLHLRPGGVRLLRARQGRQRAHRLRSRRGDRPLLHPRRHLATTSPGSRSCATWA